QDKRHEDRGAREQDGPSKPCRDDVGDLGREIRDREAEIAAEEVEQVRRVLLMDRAARKAERLAKGSERRWIELAFVSREHGRRGIAGSEAREEEIQRDRGESREEVEPELPKEISHRLKRSAARAG